MVIAAAEDCQTPRPVRSLARATADKAVAQPAVAPRRVLCGDILFETIRAERSKAMQLLPTGHTVVLVIALLGRVTVTAEEFDEDGSSRTALLLARPGAAKAIWQAGSQGMVIHLPRRRIQAAASQQFGAPQRLANINLPLAREAATERLFVSAGGVFQPAVIRKDVCSETARSLTGALIEALRAPSYPDARSPFIAAGSVQRTLSYIRDPTTVDYSPQRLAAAAGVTERTLRDNFRNVLGQSLPTVIQRCRLEAARARLASALDSRPIQAFALQAGFKSAAAFARAYQRLFGESPTTTRVLATKNFGRHADPVKSRRSAEI